jgi:hypothetical protein
MATLQITAGVADTKPGVPYPCLCRTDSMIEQLTAEVSSRIDAISASLTPQERTADAVRFLREMKDSPASSIKQAPQAAQRALSKTRNPDIGMAELVRVGEEEQVCG